MRVLHVMTGLTAAIAVLALNVPTGAFEAPSAQGVWLHDFNQAMKQAHHQWRPVLVHFHSQLCPPCRRMERESLNSPEVLGMIKNSFVAVKVDVERYPEIARRYSVESWPTDMILAPNGGVISSTNGYVTKQEYISSAVVVEAKYAQAKRAREAQMRQAQIAAAEKAQRRERAAAAERARSTPPTETVSRGKDQVPYPTEDPSAGAPIRSTAPQVALNSTPAETAQTALGMALDGYCPVTLRQTRSWKKGNSDYAFDYNGQTYHFLGASEMSTFKSNPPKYAPRNLGCDPVVLSENDLAAPGTTKFGAYFDGELYLFKSSETRTRFRNDPVRYSRARHVLKPEDLQKRRL